MQEIVSPCMLEIKFLKQSKIQKTYIVDIALKSCSCKKWDLRGILCCHGVSTILADKSQPEDFVDNFYHKEIFFKAYNQVIYPIPNMTMWVNTEGDVILPPKIRIAPGRPKKARRRGVDQPKNPNVVRKHCAPVKCGKCKQEGHNSRTCKVILDSNNAKKSTNNNDKNISKEVNTYFAQFVKK